MLKIKRDWCDRNEYKSSNYDENKW